MDQSVKEQVRIRRLEFEDLPGVLRIERASFPNPWSLAMFMLELSKPSGVHLAAVTPSGQLLGYLVCSRYASVWHLMNVAVHPDHRRQRIANSLLGCLFRSTTSHEPKAEFTLEVRLSNQPAIEMYRALGFESTGLRRGYYQNDGEDALIMWFSVESEARPQQQPELKIKTSSK